jgi:ubiquinone/menaquinone biosynthesis C-methylase UbiE
VLEGLPEMSQKLLIINTMLPVAQRKVQSTPEAITAKRKGILEGYRGKAAGKGIPWKENSESLRARGLDVWERERAECTDPNVTEPGYWEIGGKGTLHSYNEGNCCWEAAFDAALGAYELVHAHHFPEVPAQECFFKLHRTLDEATIDALEGGPARVAVDVGCGTGTSTFSLRETLNSRGLESCQLTGIDLSTYFLAVARYRQKAGDKKDTPGALGFIHGNALQVPMADGEVDIFMASALTHELPLKASEHVIAEAARTLRMGGVFGYFDLNSTQLLRDNPVSNIVDRVAISNEPFLHEFLAFDLEGTLQSKGFEMKEVRATNVAKWENWQDCPCRIVIAKKVADVPKESGGGGRPAPPPRGGCVTM